jgi:hypothetical protein
MVTQGKVAGQALNASEETQHVYSINLNPKPSFSPRVCWKVKANTRTVICQSRSGECSAGQTRENLSGRRINAALHAQTALRVEKSKYPRANVTKQMQAHHILRMKNRLLAK